MFKALLNYLKNEKSLKKLFVTHLVLIIGFSFGYYIISNYDLTAFSNNKPMKKFDALYFSVITHSTTGYGDVYPKTTIAKSLTMIHVLIVFFLTFMEINQFI
jgi:voltage-gated potassium channel